MSQRVVIAMTGSTGQIYGVRLLELLEDTAYETHLILSRPAKLNVVQESEYEVEEIVSLASDVHDNDNVGAATASGSFQTEGTIIAPCSMKTLSNIAHGNAGNLITRTGDVTLKERRPLVLMPREKPFNRIHIENMLKATDAGAIIMPPFPSFYNQDDSMDQMITRTCVRTLSLLDLDAELELEEWTGMSSNY